MADGLSGNPYQAPKAVVGDVSVGEAAPPRPRVVVVTLVFGWIGIALFAAAVSRFTFHFVRDWNAVSHVGSTYLRLGWRAAVLITLGVMVAGLHRRTRIGQWLGAIFVLTILGISLKVFVTGNAGKGDFFRNVGVILAAILVCGPMVYWFYAFTLARKARTWFNWVPAPDAPR